MVDVFIPKYPNSESEHFELVSIEKIIKKSDDLTLIVLDSPHYKYLDVCSCSTWHEDGRLLCGLRFSTFDSEPEDRHYSLDFYIPNYTDYDVHIIPTKWQYYIFLFDKLCVTDGCEELDWAEEEIVYE